MDAFLLIAALIGLVVGAIALVVGLVLHLLRPRTHVTVVILDDDDDP